MATTRKPTRDQIRLREAKRRLQATRQALAQVAETLAECEVQVFFAADSEIRVLAEHPAVAGNDTVANGLIAVALRISNGGIRLAELAIFASQAAKAAGSGPPKDQSPVH